MMVPPPELAEVVTPGLHGPGSARPIRILFNRPDPSLRGGPPTHLPILEHALSSSVEVHSFAYGRKSDSENLVEKLCGRVRDLGHIRKLCRTVRPDLIHHNSSFDHRAILRDAPLVLLAKREQLPIFIKFHGSLPEALLRGSVVLNHAREIVLRNVACIGVLSPIERREFEEAFPYLQGRVRVVKNIISSGFFEVQRREAERPTILFVSRFLRKKGLFDLLHAVPLVLAKEPETEFVFVGDGEDAAAFDRELASMNVCAAVRHVPHTENRKALPLYAGAWMLVLPTHFPEGMPMVVGEAMAAGVPIISTPTRFSRSYMTEGVHVLLHQPGDVEGIADRILQLSRESGLREQMSVANRKLACEHFTCDRIAQEYVGIYCDILNRKAL